MRILVTGGMGFIGSHIVEAYLAQGHHVAVVDNLWPHGGGRRENISPDVRRYIVDITDSAVAEVFERERPHVVCHHAAQHSARISTEMPALDAHVNILGLLNILENCRIYRTHKLIFASSAATYGAQSSMPLSEETPQSPTSPYGITKMAAEYYVHYYQATHGLNYTMFRYGNVYGPRQDPNGEAGVIAIFADRVLTGKPVRIDWDGEQARDYVYVDDIAAANVLALHKGLNRTYCLGTGIPSSVNDVYRQLVRLIGRDTGVIRAPQRSGDIRLSYFDTTRAREELGWTSGVSLEHGLRRVIKFLGDRLNEHSASTHDGARNGAHDGAHDGAHERMPAPQAQAYQALTSHVAARLPSTERITLEISADDSTP